MSSPGKPENETQSAPEPGRESASNRPSGTETASIKNDVTQPVKNIDSTAKPAEFGGQAGPEPTRYGDWEKNGRCTDF